MYISNDFEKYINTNHPIQTGLHNKVLRQKSVKVEKITDKIKEFADVLYASMQLYDGIGLASPQIGENIRMVAVCQLNKKEDKIISSQVLINPEIIEKSSKTFIQEEGCLSLPGMEGDVKRFYKIKVKYQDVNGKTYEMNLTGTNASIVQHEIDHLDGILFWDKVIHKDKGLDLKNFIKL